MLHVVDQIEQQSEGVEYKNQLLGVLKSNKEKVDECYKAIQELWNRNNNNLWNRKKVDECYNHQRVPVESFFDPTEFNLHGGQLLLRDRLLSQLAYSKQMAMPHNEAANSPSYCICAFGGYREKITGVDVGVDLYLYILKKERLIIEHVIF
ncbi:hypothetical protein K1719_022744 [Acacia pycnantha]|nr:hypothetical protein K1719_022744 [Acacia pycnantha]